MDQFEKTSLIIKFDQKAWLKSYIDINAKLQFFKLMSDPAFGKTMESVRKHRDIKIVTAEKK